MSLYPSPGQVDRSTKPARIWTDAELAVAHDQVQTPMDALELKRALAQRPNDVSGLSRLKGWSIPRVEQAIAMLLRSGIIYEAGGDGYAGRGSRGIYSVVWKPRGT